jgi:hypothetical protein
MRILLLLIAVGLYVLVSSITYTDEVMAEAVYCQNYFDRIHPDYAGLVKQGVCNQYVE